MSTSTRQRALAHPYKNKLVNKESRRWLLITPHASYLCCVTSHLKTSWLKTVWLSLMVLWVKQAQLGGFHLGSPRDMENGGWGCSHTNAQSGCTSLLHILLAVAQLGLSTRALPCGLFLGGWLHPARQLDSKRELARNKCSRRPGLKMQGSWWLRFGSHAALPSRVYLIHQTQVTERAQTQEEGNYTGMWILGDVVH